MANGEILLKKIKKSERDNMRWNENL